VNILVFNAGSSSIKFALFGDGLERILSGQASEIGWGGQLEIAGERQAAGFADHVSALEAIFVALEQRGIRMRDLDGVAHRVVHGGTRLVAPCRVTAQIMAEIEACIALAPLHNPHNLAVIRAVAAIAPDLAQFATFDTAFHATIPELASRYAIPDAEAAKGIRRYGFHGISYEGIVERLPAIAGEALPKRLLAMHLGNGASLCAIEGGQSVATTMGYSPLEGLTMGTRCGEIDGNAVLRLAADHGIEGAARILNRESGLLGLGGKSDMRELHAAATVQADFAIEHFCYWAARHAGSMIAAMSGLDAIAFTGGIGENDASVRLAILDKLAWTGLRIDRAANASNARCLHAHSSAIRVFIVPADEERTMAEAVLANAGRS
jgi:acetate kinase